MFTDFEDSARDGVRFRSHAVGMWHIDPSTDIVFGVDYQGQDQIQVLPVFGISIHNVWMDELRIDLVFPRPRVTWRLSDSHRMYLAGEIEGGEWDIEFPNEANQVIS